MQLISFAIAHDVLPIVVLFERDALGGAAIANESTVGHPSTLKLQAANGLAVLSANRDDHDEGAKNENENDRPKGYCTGHKGDARRNTPTTKKKHQVQVYNKKTKTTKIAVFEAHKGR